MGIAAAVASLASAIGDAIASVGAVLGVSGAAGAVGADAALGAATAGAGEAAATTAFSGALATGAASAGVGTAAAGSGLLGSLGSSLLTGAGTAAASSLLGAVLTPKPKLAAPTAATLGGTSPTTSATQAIPSATVPLYAAASAGAGYGPTLLTSGLGAAQPANDLATKTLLGS